MYPYTSSTLVDPLKTQIFLFFLVLMLMGCGSQHQLMAPAEYNKLNEPFKLKAKAENSEQTRWWKLFQDQELQQVLLKGLNENYTIRTNLAKIEQRKIALGKVDSNYAPTLSLNSSAGKRQTVSKGFDTPVSKQSEQFSLSLDFKYNLDLFGAGDAEQSAAELELIVSIEELKQSISELTSSYIKNWIQRHELESRIQLTNFTLKADQENLKFINDRYQLGLASLMDIFQAQQQLITTKTQLPGLKSRLLSNKHAMNLLLGYMPELEQPFKPLQFLDKINPQSLELSSELIKNRPDLRAALARIKIADHQIGVAVAAQFPQLSFSASAGTQSDKAADLFDADYFIWNLLGNITMPLLDGERRKLEVLRKKSLLQERVINYQSLLFKVINDIRERLKKIELQIEKITLIKRQIEITEQTLKIATDNYTQGLGDWVKVTAVFNQLQGSRSSLLTAQRELLETKIDLLVALGGQWIDNLLTSSRYKSVEDLAK